LLPLDIEHFFFLKFNSHGQEILLEVYK
jgi:hypothetical protein